MVDASVAVKWFLPEPDAGHAKAILRQDERLIAPDVVSLEVIGAAVRRYRENELTEEEVRRINAAWAATLASGRLSLHPVHELTGRALDLSLLARHALVDCTYIALAERAGAALVTADEPLRDRGIKVYPRIRLLRESP